MTRAMQAASGAGRIVVTGANGFIGRHLTESLHASGHSVVGIARGPARVPVTGVETVFARDIMDGEAIRRALSGASAVIHLAARVHAEPEGSADPESECRRINVDGTRLLMESAVAAGAPAGREHPKPAATVSQTVQASRGTVWLDHAPGPILFSTSQLKRVIPHA